MCAALSTIFASFYVCVDAFPATDVVDSAYTCFRSYVGLQCMLTCVPMHIVFPREAGKPSRSCSTHSWISYPTTEVSSAAWQARTSCLVSARIARLMLRPLPVAQVARRFATWIGDSASLGACSAAVLAPAASPTSADWVDQVPRARITSTPPSWRRWRAMRVTRAALAVSAIGRAPPGSLAGRSSPRRISSRGTRASSRMRRRLGHKEPCGRCIVGGTRTLMPCRRR